MTAYQHGGHSTYHGTYSAAERGGAGVGGYFADEAAQLTDGHNTVPGTEGFYSSEQSYLSHCSLFIEALFSVIQSVYVR